MSLTRLAPQRGRTLIELLVAIALGLLILLGVGGLYLSSNQTTRAATSLAGAENVGQVALAMIGNSIRRSGYSEIIGTELSGLSVNVLYQGPTLRACSGARFVGDNPDNACGTSVEGAPDSLAIWFQANNALASEQGVTDDCVGSAASTVTVTDPNFSPRVASIPVVSNNFFVEGNNLRCAGATTQPLLSGVEDMKVYFGFDDFAFNNPAMLDVAPAARSVRDAAAINSKGSAPGSSFSAWDYVVSITVCVLVRTEEQGVSTQSGTITYQQCPQNADQAAGHEAIATETAADGRIRRAYTQTFAVRSRSRPSPLAG